MITSVEWWTKVMAVVVVLAVISGLILYAYWPCYTKQELAERAEKKRKRRQRNIDVLNVESKGGS